MSGANLIRAAKAFPPGEFIRDELETRGWTEVEFSQIIGRPVQAVSEILNGKKEITAETAVLIGDALGTSAELWLNLQSVYRLHEVRNRHSDSHGSVARRARLRSLVPVRELQKVGWLPETDDIDDLEHAVCDLLGIDSPASEPSFVAAARRANATVDFSPEQVAWIARVKRLAQRHHQGPYQVGRVSELGSSIAQRVQDPYDLVHLGSWLAEYGVALVIEQPIRGSKIDGVVMFDETGTPTLGLSTRGDRMDGFLFTLLHELAHLALQHIQPHDVYIDEDIVSGAGESRREASANELAGRWMFPNGLQLGPDKPAIAEILAAAREAGVHSSLVIGRLQKEGRIAWGDLRRHIPKVRPFVRFG